MVSATHVYKLARSAPYFSPFSFQLKQNIQSYTTLDVLFWDVPQMRHYHGKLLAHVTRKRVFYLQPQNSISVIQRSFHLAPLIKLPVGNRIWIVVILLFQDSLSGAFRR